MTDTLSTVNLPADSTVYTMGLTSAAWQQKFTLTQASGDSQDWTGSGEHSHVMQGPYELATDTDATKDDIVVCTYGIYHNPPQSWPPSYVPGELKIALQNFVQWTVISEDGGDRDFNDCVFSIRWWTPGTDVQSRDPEPLPHNKRIYVEAFTNTVYKQRITLVGSGHDPFEGSGVGMKPMTNTPTTFTTSDNDISVLFERQTKDGSWVKAVQSDVQHNTLGRYHQHTWVARHKEQDPEDQDHAVLCIHWWD